MKQIISRPFTYMDLRRCTYGCCNSEVLGMKKILQEKHGGPSCIVQEFIRDTHGYTSSIRGYNIHFKEPIVVSMSMCMPGEDSVDFVIRMRRELRVCAIETAIKTIDHASLKMLYGQIPPTYSWGLRDGKS